MPNSRDSEKTETIVVHCDEDTKADWEYHASYHEDNADALSALLQMRKEHPDLIETYR
jgi:hypothetical protein